MKRVEFQHVLLNYAHAVVYTPHRKIKQWCFMRVAREFENRPALVDLGESKIFALLDLPLDDRE